MRCCCSHNQCTESTRRDITEQTIFGTYFPNSRVLGKRMRRRVSRTCPGIDQFRYSSFRVQHVGENAENV